MSIFSTAAIAQSAASAAPAGPSMIETFLPFGFVLVAMYFLMIRPQAKKAKEQSDFLSQLKNGDEVVTSGGIIGRIRGITDEFVTLDCGSGSIKVVKGHVARSTKVVEVAKSSKKEAKK